MFFSEIRLLQMKVAICGGFFIGTVAHRVHKLNCRNIATQIPLNIDPEYIRL